MTPDSLIRTLQDFLAEAHDAVVLEQGAVLFDLAQSKYSISGEYNKCLLHLWSDERNIVRRVVDLEIRQDVLRLAVQRLGQASPTKLEICRERDRRTPSAKRAARSAYQNLLRRVLERGFPAYEIASLSTAMDLERSFGPIYARGLVKRGQSAFAVLGVNSQELQSSIDAALTFGIVWLDVCRQAQAGKCLVEGLKLFLPAGRSQLTRERISHVNSNAAKWQLYELHEREDSLTELDPADHGNAATHLVHAPDEAALQQRFSEAIAVIHGLMPEVQIFTLSPAEVAFRCNGLEFARARLAHDPVSFRTAPEIVFGLGAEERVLTAQNMPELEHLIAAIGEVRHAEGPRDSRFWRLRPERWLESLVVKQIAALDDRLDASCVYSQVPAFSAADRGMIDVLTATRQGRLTVVELKADEDIHLPLQGLDYWSRVTWHHRREEFQKFGYFPAKELSPEPPRLMLVAPALRIHPATDTLLRYLSPQVDWTLLGIDERWRDGVRVIFRKRRQAERTAEPNKAA